ncbi:MAG: HAD-IB family phosphatase [Heliobacteriaceae bacterium]|nr:HAD-IB family phosphatase [Heliobacteriaceae bacterium]MDD4586804.1 HAD-IB family phosphatase [Heliobacteriaceae bacterium]
MLIFFDVDGTLTQGPNVWEHIYRSMGIWETVGIPIQTCYFDGLIDYREFAQRDAMHFRGTGVTQLRGWAAGIPLRSQAVEILTDLSARSCRIVLLSTGLTLLTDRVAREAGISDAVANELELTDGFATGRVEIRVSGDYGPQDKGAWVRYFCRIYGVDLAHTVAIGDSSGDIPMFRQVQLPIMLVPAADKPDPVTKEVQAVKKAVPGVVESNNLETAWAMIIDFLSVGRCAGGRVNHAG